MELASTDSLDQQQGAFTATNNSNNNAFRLAEKRFKAPSAQLRKDMKKKRKKMLIQTKRLKGETELPPPPQLLGDNSEGLGEEEAILKEVFDFANVEKNLPENRDRILTRTFTDVILDCISTNIQICTVKDIPGFSFIPNPFSPLQQRKWIRNCLENWTRENPSNLDAHYNLEGVLLWEKRLDVLGGPDIRAGVEIDSITWPQALHRLRWITLGYHYDWTLKKYDFEDPKARGVFPKDLYQLSAEIGELLGWNDYRAEAGIVNYYHIKDTLMGHVDQSELNKEAPLISISFGHTAIFLLGGLTKDVPPVPIFVRSGDILIMQGPCRLFYHGVPRIMENTLPNHLTALEKDDDDWKSFADYLKDSRINLNIRQVFD